MSGVPIYVSLVDTDSLPLPITERLLLSALPQHRQPDIERQQQRARHFGRFHFCPTGVGRDAVGRKPNKTVR